MLSQSIHQGAVHLISYMRLWLQSHWDASSCPPCVAAIIASPGLLIVSMIADALMLSGMHDMRSGRLVTLAGNPMQAASPGRLIIFNYTSITPGLNVIMLGLTLTCSQATDATFMGAQMTANSSSTLLAAVAAASALELDAVIELSGTATASVSKGWHTSGLPLGPGTTLTLTSSSPDGAVIDLNMNANLISGLNNNTLHIINITLVNLCSDFDSLSIDGNQASVIMSTLCHLHFQPPMHYLPHHTLQGRQREALCRAYSVHTWLHCSHSPCTSRHT